MSNKGRPYPSLPEKDLWTLEFQAPHWYLPNQFVVQDIILTDPFGGNDYPGPFEGGVGLPNWNPAGCVWEGPSDLPSFPLYSVGLKLIYLPGWGGQRPRVYTQFHFQIAVLGFNSFGYLSMHIEDGHPDFFIGNGPIDYRGGLVTGYTDAQATWTAKNWD